jgi:hypothetical protein
VEVRSARDRYRRYSRRGRSWPALESRPRRLRRVRVRACSHAPTNDRSWSRPTTSRQPSRTQRRTSIARYNAFSSSRDRSENGPNETASKSRIVVAPRRWGHVLPRARSLLTHFDGRSSKCGTTIPGTKAGSSEGTTRNSHRCIDCHAVACALQSWGGLREYLTNCAKQRFLRRAAAHLMRPHKN